MKKTLNALIFTGQGSAYPNMGKEIYDDFDCVKNIFKIGSDIIGKDLTKLCFNTSSEELSLTINAQPAIFCVSLSAFHVLKEKNIPYSAVLGHSLGEYTALAASEIVSIEDCFKIINYRAKAMQKCAEETNGGMCAILSKDINKINEICNDVFGYVVPVNYNSLSQTVVAGDKEAINEVVAKCKGEKIKAISLSVNAAFHSKLMQSAADEFLNDIKDIKFNNPNIDFYSNITGEKMVNFNNMPEYLAKHMVSPVMFVSELNNLKNAGFTNFTEIGPGKTINGLIKKTLSDVYIHNIEKTEDIESFSIIE